MPRKRNTSAARILIKCRKYLAEPYHWTRGSFARKQHGEKAYCALGVVRYLGADNIDAGAALGKAARAKGTSNVVFFNDNVAKNKADILSLFDDAIAIANDAS